MFGAPAGAFGAGGHHGFEPATVLPILPPNGVSLPALIPSFSFCHGLWFRCAPLVPLPITARAAPSRLPMSFSGKGPGAVYLVAMVRDGALRLLTLRALPEGKPHPEERALARVSKDGRSPPSRSRDMVLSEVFNFVRAP